MLFISMLLFLTVVQGHHVCYKPYGCFNDDAPFNEPLLQLPEDPADIDTSFMLYTRDNIDVGQKLDPLHANIVNSTYFDGDKKTVMALHGYLGSSKEVWVRPLIDALLEHEDMNVIFVDWAKGANFPYHQAVGTGRVVGAQMTKMVEMLMKDHDTFDLLNFHCIGFGLGSHVCGYVGRTFKKTNRTIGRISGLDPAGPYFEDKHVDVRLDPTDAGLVDVIHTDTKGVLGMKWVGAKQALGHLDFYPNGGYNQPGCRKIDNGIFQFFACSHFRAMKYFTESINNRHCASRAYPCTNYEEFRKGLCTKCSNPDCPRMGYNSVELQNVVTGKFYLQTYDKKPFCAHHYTIAFNTGSRFAGDLNGGVQVIMTGKNDVSAEIKVPHHYYKSGSTNNFLILTKKDLGKLLKVKVNHDAWIDVWYLDSVVIRPLWTKEVYTGCYKKWLNNNDNEVKLHTGKPAYCL